MGSPAARPVEACWEISRTTRPARSTATSTPGPRRQGSQPGDRPRPSGSCTSGFTTARALSDRDWKLEEARPCMTSQARLRHRTSERTRRRVQPQRSEGDMESTKTTAQVTQAYLYGFPLVFNLDQGARY